MKLDFLFGAAKRQRRLSGVPGRISAMAFFLGIIPVLGGCSLALEEPPSVGGDRLAGIFVTEQYIEPEEPQLEVNARGEIYARDTGPRKIYGSFTGYGKDAAVVTFPDLQGYGVYSFLVPEDETHEASGYSACDSIFTDCHFTVSDTEDSLEASFYATAGSPRHYYFNPVYQQPDGQLYLVPGEGIASDSFLDGQKFSKSVAQSATGTKSGSETTKGQSFTITVIAADPPQDMELFLMDAGHQVLERYSARELDALSDTGEALRLPPRSAYLILQQTLQDETLSRQLFDEGTEYLEYKIPEEDGYLHARQLPLIWP